jgi:hypothetical protein
MKLLLLFLTAPLLAAKELVVTKEWQLVGENDTIPAGAHVRMNLTSGEKWVKLVDDDEQQQTMEVQADGTTAVMVKEETQQEPSKQASYDYDMMHRTLSKLPEDEQERMGGLPELPSGGAGSISKEERAQFEARLQEIWERRQQELKQIQEELVMDLPQVLKDRIQRIKAYLDDPSDDVEHANKYGTDKGPDAPWDIVTVLKDLEYHLTDVDMTRDFYTLGGWPLLVSLLLDEVHSNATATDGKLSRVDEIQWHAAWVVGTAVKNLGEFRLYSLEKIARPNGTMTTPLDIVVEQLAKSSTGASKKKQQRLIYAAGGMLRGNLMSQQYFVGIQGTQVLANLLSQQDIDLTKRILALAGDVVADIVLHQNDAADHADIIQAFSTPVYCQTCIDSLRHSNLQETAIRTIKVLADYCDWDEEKALEQVAAVKRTWQVDPDLDHELRRELLDLVGDTMTRIKAKAN